MALVNPNIAMSYRGVEMPQQNALADYAAIQQIQSGQRQAEVSQMQIEQMRRDDATLKQIQAKSMENGGPADLDSIADAYLKSGNPKFVEFGVGLRQKLDEKKQFASIMGNAPRAAAPASEAYPGYNEKIGMAAPTNVLAPAAAPAAAPVNAMAPAAAPGTNALADVAMLRQKRDALLSMGTPQAIAAARAFDSDIALASKPPVRQVVSAGSTVLGPDNQVIYTAPAAPVAPTDIAKLIKERDALPLNSPNRALYDKEIANRSAVAENARKRLEFDQNKFNWEKANPGFEIREADDGSVVGVNKRTLQAFPVTLGGGSAPTAAPAAGGVGMPSARVPAPQAPLAGATPTAGKPLMGRGKEAPVKFNDTDLQLSGLAGSLQDFKKEVSRDVFTGAKFLPTGQDTARMQAKYTALLMGVKDLYTLGALTGPDMGIIESQLTNPASWSGKFTTKEGFEAQTKVIEDMLKRSATNLENTYGRVPKATKKALENLLSGAGSENDPLGLLGGK